MPKITASREYRSMNPLAVLQRSQDDEAAYRAEGYATTFDVPYILFEMDGVKYYEQISSNALDSADVSDVVFRFDHMFFRNMAQMEVLETKLPQP